MLIWFQMSRNNHSKSRNEKSNNVLEQTVLIAFCSLPLSAPEWNGKEAWEKVAGIVVFLLLNLYTQYDFKKAIRRVSLLSTIKALFRKSRHFVRDNLKWDENFVPGTKPRWWWFVGGRHVQKGGFGGSSPCPFSELFKSAPLRQIAKIL